MDAPAPLELRRDVVRPEWIDYNGHMNVAYYLLAFDGSADAFLDTVGLDEAYRQATGHTTFAAECHLTYRREMMSGDTMRITAQLIGFDQKRIHFFMSMYHAEQGFLAATSEWLILHVDLGQRRVAPMPRPILDRMAEVFSTHERLPRPPEVGRAVNAPRRA